MGKKKFTREWDLNFEPMLKASCDLENPAQEFCALVAPS